MIERLFAESEPASMKMAKEEIKIILEKVVTALAVIPGIEAVVLGGSRARGTHSPESDIDIGIYYDEELLDLSSLNQAARQLDDEHRENLIVSPGEWGKWVNGGGWLLIDEHHVDLILRDIGRVECVIAECLEGTVSAHYQTGHPHAYINVMYMGELAICNILWERQGRVSAQKFIAEQYPPRLKDAIIGFFGFEAGFSLMFAKNNAQKDDLYYVMAHMVRVISALNQELFAINEEYCINEKKAVSMIENFRFRPQRYKNKVDSIFAAVGADNARACLELEQLVDEVACICSEESKAEKETI